MRIKSLIMTCLLGLSITSSLNAATLKIATLAPDGTTWMNELRAGAEQVAKETDGRVNFRFYPGGVMGNDKSVLRKIRIGQLHGGALTGGGLAAIYPDSQVYSLPLAFRDYEEADYVRAKMDQQIINNIYDNGFVSLGISEGGFAYIMSEHPIRNAVDVRQHKVWVPEGDEINNEVFKALGVSPIPLPLTDVLTGLQTGLVNAVSASPMGAIALQWHSRVKYFTDSPLVYLYGTLVVQRKAFERISAADQKSVRRIMGDVFKRLDKLNRADNEQAQAALKTQGIEFVVPSATDQNDWRSAVTQTVDQITKAGTVSPKITEVMYQHLHDFRNGGH